MAVNTEPSSVIDQQNSQITQEIQQRLRNAQRYNQWIHDLIDPYVGQRVLDAGCGIGNITELFLDRELVIGVELVPEFCQYLRKTLGSAANFWLVEGDLNDPGLTRLAAERIDTVICVNVLEHIEDDLGLLNRFRQVLQPAGTAVVFVPAHAWLYGPHDAADGHFRRYAMREVRKKLMSAGLSIEACRWVNFPGILAWALHALLGRRSFTRGECRGFDRIVPLIAGVERLIPPPVGLSILAVGRRSGGDLASDELSR